MPQGFEPARASRQNHFLSRGPGYDLLLAPNEAEIALAARPESPQAPAKPPTIRIRFLGANPRAHAEGRDLQPGASSYFIGNDPRLWRARVPHFSRVAYRGIYPGVDVAYYATGGRLEYDLSLDARAQPRQIRLAIDGADRVRIDPAGDLVLTAGRAEIRQMKPVVYQETPEGRVRVEGRYVMRDRNRVGFEISAYDRRSTLVIDPVLVFSTYLGGSGRDDGRSIALDAAGNIYVAGTTASPNFPVTSGAPFAGGTQAFVAKLSFSGSLIYAAFFGGPNDHAVGSAVAVDARGNVYLAGSTASPAFPTKNPLQAAYGGGADAFVLELNSAGDALVYSTYLGGSGLDYAHGIQVDAAGYAYVAGTTGSSDFPLRNPVQAVYKGQLTTFAAKIAPGGSSLVYSTYLGGHGTDYCDGISIDAAGNAYIFGDTSSADFPVAHAFQSAYGGKTDGFLSKLSPSGNLIYSTYIGGSGDDAVRGAQVDKEGNLVIGGGTSSPDFPLKNPIPSRHAAGSEHAWVAKLDPSGASLIYSSIIGGRGKDIAWCLALDPLRNAYLAGYTLSPDFPVVNAIQARYGGDSDAFLVKINAAGSAVFSTYLGGSGEDSISQIAVDSAGNAYVTGNTNSPDFPTANPLQPVLGGGRDAFVSVIATSDFAISPPIALTVTASAGASAPATFTIQPPAPVSRRGSFLHGLASYCLAFAWGILTLLSLAGWGGILNRLLLPKEAAAWSERAAWGLAWSIVVGGVLNLFSLISRAAVLAYLGAGIAAWIAGFLHRQIVSRSRAPEKSSCAFRSGGDFKALAAGGLLLAGLFALVLYAASVSVARTDAPLDPAAAVRFNAADDFQAYFVFPEKMLQTGSMGRDPFSARRAETSLGGQSFLDTFVLGVLSARHLRLLDPGLSLLIVLGLAWEMCSKKGVSPGWIAGLLLFLVLMDPPASGISSLYTGTALFLCLCRALDSNALEDARFFARICLIGLLAAAICCLRSSFIPACGALLASSYFFYCKSRKFNREAPVEVIGEALLVALLAAAFALPWMISMHRSSGTLFYPLLGRGFVHAHAWLPASKAVSLLFRHLADSYFVALAVLGAFHLASRPRALGGREPALSMFLGAIFGFAAVVLSGAETSDLRAGFPFLFAAVIVLMTVLMTVLMPVSMTEVVTGAVRRPGQEFELPPGEMLKSPAPLVVLVAALFLLGSSWDATRTLYTECLYNIKSGIEQTPLVSEQEAAAYRQLQQSVPPGQVILARLDKPFLLDFKRNTVFVMDDAVAGPPPGMPLARAGEPLARYLSGQSIRYVAFSYADAAGRRASGPSTADSPLTAYERLSTGAFEDSLAQLSRTRKRLFDDGSNFVLDLSQPADSPQPQPASGASRPFGL